MPIYQIDIEKELAGEFWTNVYHVNTPTMADAVTQGHLLVGNERTITKTPVKFTKFRVSDLDPNTDTFIITPINEFGTAASLYEDMLPLFNCVRVDFAAATGRPGRKYLRGCLSEADVSFAGALNPASVTAVNTSYALEVVENTDTVKPNGVALVDGSTNSRVAMRQLRRGSKRRTQPILP